MRDKFLYFSPVIIPPIPILVFCPFREHGNVGEMEAIKGFMRPLECRFDDSLFSVFKLATDRSCLGPSYVQNLILGN